MGYVLGARAGRERYEQIKDAADKAWNTPTVQKGVDAAKDFAMARVTVVSDAVLDGAKKLVGAATNAQKSSNTRASASSPRTTATKAPARSSSSDSTTSKPATTSATSKASTAKKE